jgi:DNA-directed RNA polymerase subunit RPC12/RpoP
LTGCFFVLPHLQPKLQNTGFYRSNATDFSTLSWEEYMSIINLADAKVSYEGQTLPAINLISKLQVQLQETASRLAAMAATLGQLQTALLNSHSVEVKLTLSKEDYDRFRALGGVDDSDRIRKALINLIRTEEAEISPAPVESRVVVAESVVPVLSQNPEPQPVKRVFQEQPIASETGPRKKPVTKCPRCQSQIDLSEFSSDQWPVEVKCSNCGAKCLIKSKTVSTAKTDKGGFEPLDEAAYGKLFDMLST